MSAFGDPSMSNNVEMIACDNRVSACADTIANATFDDGACATA